MTTKSPFGPNLTQNLPKKQTDKKSSNDTSWPPKTTSKMKRKQKCKLVESKQTMTKEKDKLAK